MLEWIGNLLGIGNEAMKGWQDRKTQRVKTETVVAILNAKAQIEAAKAKVDAAKRGEDIEADYDKTAMGAMEHSWKDEYLCILISIPFIMCFIPGLQKYTEIGWDYLSKAPAWYQWSFVGIVSASFGTRWVVKYFNAKLPSC